MEKKTKKELSKKERQCCNGGESTGQTILDDVLREKKCDLPPIVKAIINPKYTATYVGENLDGEKYERT